MSMEDIGHGLSRAWDTLAAGWRELRERAGHALTHYTPAPAGGEQAGSELLAGRASRWALLAAEVSADDEAVHVRLEAPGMQAGDFDIAVLHGNLLRVSGHKHLERSAVSGTFYVTERAYGSFERVVQLPVAVDETGAQASYRQGVLSLTLRRHHAVRPRRITVSQG